MANAATAPGDGQQPAGGALSDEQQNEIVFNLLVQAWQDAVGRNVSVHMVTQTTLGCAIMEMISQHGRDETAELLTRVAARVRSGEFASG